MEQGRGEAFSFTGRFLFFLVSSFGALSIVPTEYFFQPLVGAFARSVETVLVLMGYPVVMMGQQVVLPKVFGIHIAEECSQVEEWLVILCAVLAYPTSLGTRLNGAALVTVTAFLGNLLRLVTLFWVGVEAGSYFDFIHSYFWPVLIYVGLVVLWIIWLHVGIVNLTAEGRNEPASHHPSCTHDVLPNLKRTSP